VDKLLGKWRQTLNNVNPSRKEKGGTKEQDYRNYYLKSDINQSRKSTLLFALPILGFIINDYLFFGFSSLFLGLLIIRAFLLLVTGLEVAQIGKAKTPRNYDLLIFWTTLTLIICE